MKVRNVLGGEMTIPCPHASDILLIVKLETTHISG
jgi:hypothetical protein